MSPYPDFPPGHAAQRDAQRRRAFTRWAMQRWHHLPANLRGALWVLASVILFTVMQAMAKILSRPPYDLHGFQIAFFRSVTGLVFILPFILRTGVAGFKTTRPFLMTVRGMVGATATLCGFYAIANLPLAEATALSFSRALFLVPLAVLILSESVGPRRAIATFTGFIGVVMIAFAPAISGGNVSNIGDVLATFLTHSDGTGAAIGNAFFVALAIIFVKILSKTDSTVTLLFYSGVIGTITTAAVIWLVSVLDPGAQVWQSLSLMEYGLVFALGAFGVLAHNCFIRGYAIGEATALSPLDYMRILFSGLVGYLFFAEMVTPLTVVGAVIVAGSSLYITYRESQKRVDPTPVDETGTPAEPLEYALRQFEEKEMMEADAAEGFEGRRE